MSDMDGASANDANVQDGQQHSSVNAETEELKSIILDLQGQVRALQGNKDRGTHQTKKELDRLTKRVNEFTEMQTYLEKYENPSEAARQMELDRMIREGKGLQEDIASGADDAGLADLQKSQAKADEELFELLGVDASSPEYTKAISQGLSPLEAAKAVAKANRTGSQIGEGEATGITGGMGGSTGISGSQKQILQSQYEAELEENKDVLQGNPWHVELLKRKYREKGLEIW